MPEYEYSAWVTVRADSEASAAERIEDAQGLLDRMTTVSLSIDDGPPVVNDDEDED